MNVELTIGEVAARTGCSVSAIRYYEDEGFIPSIRNAAGHRCFHRSTLRRISFILIAKELGYSLKNIRKVLSSLPDGRTPTKGDWYQLSKTFSVDLQERIASLQSLKDRLDQCIGCGCLSLQACQIYNHDDIARSFGDGPRYLKGDKPVKRV